MYEKKRLDPSGPAFPIHEVAYAYDNAWHAFSKDPGMSQRAYFAAHCPITLTEAKALLVRTTAAGDITGGVLLDFFAKLRWRYADAMIEAQAFDLDDE